jgi:Domain of unknown function (DUF4397)
MRLSQKMWLAVLCCAAMSLCINGCVDVDNSAVSTVDIRSSVRFINLSNNGSAMDVNVDGSTIANAVNYANASSYIDLPAGTRNFIFSFGAVADTFRAAIPNNYKSSYYSIFESAAGDTKRSYILASERQTYAGLTAFTAGNILVRFINLSEDTAAAVIGGVNFRLVSSSIDSTTDALKFSKGSGYIAAPVSSNPQFQVLGADASTIIQSTAVSSSEGRYTVVLYGCGAVQAKVFQED